MAYFNEDTGEILLTSEDREVLQNGLGKNWARNIINWIIWGDKKIFYDK